jgi:FKBP-type peptidyl-prolyl cis-trans isomerase
MVRRARLSAFVPLMLAVLPLLAAGCGDSPSSPSGWAPYSQIDLVFGDGASAETGKVLTVNYTGWFYDSTKGDKKGMQFTTSAISGPAVFTAGANTVIAGWEKGVLGMKEGGQRRLVIPPSLAYGPSRYSAIPPNATLVFDLELVKVE